MWSNQNKEKYILQQKGEERFMVTHWNAFSSEKKPAAAATAVCTTATAAAAACTTAWEGIADNVGAGGFMNRIHFP